MSLTVSLIAVLIPLLFMGDVVGRSLPPICGDAGRHDSRFRVYFPHAHADDVLAVAEHIDPSTNRAGSTAIRSAGLTLPSLITGERCRLCCAIATTTLIITFATLVATILLYIYVPKGFSRYRILA